MQINVVVAGFDLAIEIIESFGPVFLKLREARRREAFHTITDFSLLHVLTHNRCNFFSMLPVKFVG